MVRPAVAMHLPMPPVRAEVDRFASRADAYIMAFFPDYDSKLDYSVCRTVLCDWCKGIHKSKTNCCPNCGGPRE